MNKIIKKIYRFIDKLIIVPISRLIYNIQNFMKTKGGFIEKVLNRPTFLIYFSLGLALIFFLLIDSKVISLVKNNAEVITKVPVSVKYNEEAYVLEGVPETVDITLTGRKGDIYLAKQLGEFEVMLDMTNYTPSESAYKVYFTYNKNIDNLVYRLDPSYVSVVVKNKVSSVFPIESELINTHKLLPKLSVKDVSLANSEVVVKGSEQTLEKIAQVKALIDLDNSDLKESGSYDVDSKLVAYDSAGNVINNVEIVPNTVSSTILLDSYSVNLPIEIITNGNLKAGKSIASILINNQEKYSLTVYGNEKELNNLKSFPVGISVDGLGSDNVKTFNVNLVKPNGVRYMSATSVTVTLTFGNEQQKTMSIETINKRNLGANLNANIISGSQINVICKGVTSALDKISVSDVKAYVDLTGLGVGDHDVPIQIENNNPLVTYVVESTIKVRITKE